MLLAVWKDLELGANKALGGCETMVGDSSQRSEKQAADRNRNNKGQAQEVSFGTRDLWAVGLGLVYVALWGN